MIRILTIVIFMYSLSVAVQKPVIKMSTTTSTENTGLLKYLLPEFSKEENIDIQVIAAGSGKALQLAANGDVDLVFSHAPDDEAALVSKGIGVDYWKVMYNDFVIAGPSGDFAGIGMVDGVVAAFQKIASSQAVFISRGDESGTHKKEKEIWAAASIVPSGKWYMSAGQGMEACLIIANEKPAYILTDRGTFLSIAQKINLTVVSEGDSLMKNQYGIMAVNPEKYKLVKYKEAKAFIDWIISEKGQELIASYTVNGMQLFFPNASK